MKKLFLLLTAVLLMTACSSDDPVGNNSNIIGYWECTGISLHEIECDNPESIKNVERDLASGSGTDWTFGPDGRCYTYDGGDTFEYTYTIKGNILEVLSPEDGVDINEFYISGNTMAMYADETKYYLYGSAFKGVTKVITKFTYIRK